MKRGSPFSGMRLPSATVAASGPTAAAPFCRAMVPLTRPAHALCSSQSGLDTPAGNGRSAQANPREAKMLDKKTLCDKIRQLYPDIGECGIDVEVDYDQAQKTWVVHLKKDNQKLKTFLEDGDAEKCLLGQKCVGLGIEIAQLRANIERMKEA
jgi:hypothetical protein